MTLVITRSPFRATASRVAHVKGKTKKQKLYRLRPLRNPTFSSIARGYVLVSKTSHTRRPADRRLRARGGRKILDIALLFLRFFGHRRTRIRRHLTTECTKS